MKIPRVNKSSSGFIEDEKYLLRWPFNMVVVGKTGAGKGNVLLHMIVSTKVFNIPDIIYYYGPNAYQDDMTYLKNITDAISRKIGYEF